MGLESSSIAVTPKVTRLVPGSGSNRSEKSSSLITPTVFKRPRIVLLTLEDLWMSEALLLLRGGINLLGLAVGEAFWFIQSSGAPPSGSCFPESRGPGNSEGSGGGPLLHRHTAMRREQAASKRGFDSGGSGIIENKQPGVAVLLQTKY